MLEMLGKTENASAVHARERRCRPSRKASAVHMRMMNTGGRRTLFIASVVFHPLVANRPQRAPGFLQKCFSIVLRYAA